MNDRKGTLVVCLGNEFRGDDAVGIFIARQLKVLGLSDNEVIEAGMALMGSVSQIEQISPEVLMIVDAADMGIPPGDWKMIEPDKIAEAGLSTHENNIPMFLTYISSALPDTKVHFLGIQPLLMDMTDSIMLTDPVRKGALALIGRIGSSQI